MINNDVEFWNQRHKGLDSWNSGGDRALGVARNMAFYKHRLGLLLGVLAQNFVFPGDTVLDAGCGKGWLTIQLNELGFNTTGIDSSESAINLAKKSARNDKFHISTLSTFTSDLLYDAVVCMDVLFHIMNDDEWQKSIINLSRITSYTGVLIIADDLRDERYYLGNYIVHRSKSEYLYLLESLGFHLIESIPYCYAGNPNQFHIFRRVNLL